MSEKRTTDTEEQPNKPRRWRPTKRQALWAVGLALLGSSILVAAELGTYRGIRWGYVPPVLILLFILIRLGNRYKWTGFKEKTLWDWVQLLSAAAMPVVLTIAGLWFTAQQDRSAQEIEDERAQDAALQTYLDQMGTLLLAKDGLRESEEGSEIRT